LPTPSKLGKQATYQNKFMLQLLSFHICFLENFDFFLYLESFLEKSNFNVDLKGALTTERIEKRHY
jgi:hypothetical protein